MYSKCQNIVPHVSNLARYAREFQQEGPKGQRTEPSTGEFHDETATKMSEMGNGRTLQQENHMTKVAQNDKNGQRTDPATGEFLVKSAEK